MLNIDPIDDSVKQKASDFARDNNVCVMITNGLVEDSNIFLSDGTPVGYVLAFGIRENNPSLRIGLEALNYNHCFDNVLEKLKKLLPAIEVKTSVIN
jgi:hypothetical protein